MTNVFDQFDEPQTAPQTAAPGPASGPNPFDQFDAPGEVMPAPPRGMLLDRQIPSASDLAAKGFGRRPTIAEETAPMVPSTVGGTAWAGLRGAADTLTFGQNERLQAALQAASDAAQGKGFDYGARLERQRGMTQAARGEHPIAFGAGEVAGGLAPYGEIAKGAEAAGTAASNLPIIGKALSSPWTQAGATGAAYGAAQSAGHGQDIGTGAALGAAAGIGGKAVGDIIAGVAGRAAGLLNERPQTQTVSDLRAAKTAAYRKVDEMGVSYTPDAFSNLVGDIAGAAKEYHLNPLTNPKAAGAINELQDFSKTMESRGYAPTLTEVDQIRQFVNRELGGANDKGERFFGNMMVRKIDKFINGAGETALAPGMTATADEAASAISKARALNTIVEKASEFDKARASAELRAASSGTGGNADNALRQNARRLLEKGRSWSPDEKNLLNAVVRGTPIQNLARLAGRLSPTSGALPLMGGFAASTFHPAGVAVPAAGYAAKAIADRMTQTNADRLMAAILAGGTRSATEVPSNYLQNLIQLGRSPLGQSLAIGGYDTGR